MQPHAEELLTKMEAEHGGKVTQAQKTADRERVLADFMALPERRVVKPQLARLAKPVKPRAELTPEELLKRARRKKARTTSRNARKRNRSKNWKKR